jgi:DNA recombination protein RmuC
MLIVLLIVSLMLLVGIAYVCFRLGNLKNNYSEQEALARELLDRHHEQRAEFDKHSLLTNQSIQSSVTQQMGDLREQIQGSLKQHQSAIAAQFEQLTQVTRNKLSDISQQVDKTLSSGFEKTTATFQDVMKRLTIIDQAQKEISNLSTHVVNLQEILVDNRSRGAFGEVQLSALIRNMVPETHFSMQHTLSNGKRVDCLLCLPQPTGNIAVDAKFPLNTYRQMSQSGLSDTERKLLQQQFKRDIKTHISDIATKYQIPGETADGAIMFIPAEVIFAEIHGQHPDLIDYAHQNRVWLTSPTTMMAILTTARAVIKDEATRQQVHIIQKHLGLLGQDFDRFQKRMDQLSKHINQAQQDVEQVHTSSKKISRRFYQIESVEFEPANTLVENQE